MKQLKQLLINQTGGEGAVSTNPNQTNFNATNAHDSVIFNKTLLEYDYGEDEEESEKTIDSAKVPTILEASILCYSLIYNINKTIHFIREKILLSSYKIQTFCDNSKLSKN